MLKVWYGDIAEVIYNTSVYFKFTASNCGNNCAAWLLRIGQKKDVTVNLRHLMDFGDAAFDLMVMNTGDIVHSMDDLIPIAGRYV